MSWNYRVVHRRGEHLGQRWETFAIYEVYYNAAGKPHYIAADPAPVMSETLEGLREMRMMMAMALRSPVLEYDDVLPGLEHEREWEAAAP